MNGPETALNMRVNVLILALMISWEFVILTLAHLNKESAERDTIKVTELLKARQSRTGLLTTYLRVASKLEVNRKKNRNIFKLSSDPADDLMTEFTFKPHVCGADRSWDSNWGHGDSKQQDEFEEILKESKTETWQYLKHQRNLDGVVVSDVYQPLFNCDNEILSIKFTMTRHSDPHLMIKTRSGDSVTQNQCRCIKRRHGSSQLLRIHFKDCYVHYWTQGRRKYYTVRVLYFDRLLMRNVSGSASCHAAIEPHSIPSTGASPEVLCGKSYIIVKLPAKKVLHANVLGLPLHGSPPVLWKSQHTVFVKIKHSAIEDGTLQLIYLDMTGKAQAITASCVQHKLHYKKVVRRQVENPSNPITSVPSNPTTLRPNTYIGSTVNDALGFGWGFSDIPMVPYLPVLTTAGSLQSSQVIGTTTVPQTKQTASRLTTFPEMTSLASMSGEEKSTEKTLLVDTTATGLETSTAAITTARAPSSPGILTTAAKSVSISTMPVQSPITAEIRTTLAATLKSSTTLVKSTSPMEAPSPALTSSYEKTSRTTFSDSTAEVVLGKSTPALTTNEAPASAETKSVTTTSVKTTVAPSPSATSTERITFGTTPSVGIVLDSTTPARTVAEALTSAKMLSVSTTVPKTSLIAATSGKGMTPGIALEMFTSDMTISPTSAETASVSTTPFATTPEVPTLSEITFVSTTPVETTSTTMRRAGTSVSSEVTSISRSPVGTSSTTTKAIAIQSVTTGKVATTAKVVPFSTLHIKTSIPVAEATSTYKSTEETLLVSTTATGLETSTAAITTAQAPSSPGISTTAAKSVSISTIPVQSPFTAEIRTTSPATLKGSTTLVKSTSPMDAASPALTSSYGKTSRTTSSDSTAEVVLGKSTPALATTNASAEIKSVATTSVETTVAPSPSATSTERITFGTTPSAGIVLDSTTPARTVAEALTSAKMLSVSTTVPKTSLIAATSGKGMTPGIALEMFTSDMTISPTSAETASVSTTPFATTPEVPTLSEITFVSTTPVETTSTTMRRAGTSVSSEVTSISRSPVGTSSTTTEAIAIQSVTTGKVATTAKVVPFSTSHIKTSIPVAEATSTYKSTEETLLVSTTATGLETSTAAITTAQAPSSPGISTTAAKSVSISTIPVQSPFTAEIRTTSPATLKGSTTLVKSTSPMDAASPALTSSYGKTSRTTFSDSTAEVILGKSTPALATTNAPASVEMKLVATTSVKTTVAPSTSATSTEKIKFGTTPSAGIVLETTTRAKTAAEALTSAKMSTIPRRAPKTTLIAATSGKVMAPRNALEMSTSDMTISPTSAKTTSVSTTPFVKTSTTMTRTEGSVTSELTFISMQPVMTGEVVTTDKTILSSTSTLATTLVEGMTSETVPSHSATEDGLELSTTAPTSERPTGTTSLTAEVPSSPEISATTAKSMSTTCVESSSPTESTSTAFASTGAKTSSTTPSKNTAVIVLEKSTPALTTSVAPTSAEMTSHLSPAFVKTTVASSSSATSTKRITFKMTPSLGNILDTTTPTKTMPFSTTATLTEKIASLTTPSFITTGIVLETSMPSVTIAGVTTSAETMTVSTLSSKTATAVQTSNVTSENAPIADPFTGADNAISFGWDISDIPLVPYIREVTETETIGSLQSTQVVGTTTIPQTGQTAVTNAHVEIASKLTTTTEITVPMSSEEITPFATTLEAPTLGKTIFVSATPVETTIPVEMATSSFMTALPAATTERLMSGKTPSISTQGISSDTSTTMTSAEALVTSEMTSIFTSSTEISATSEAISMQPMTTGKEATTAKTLPFSTSHVETSIRTTPSVGIVLDTTTPAKTTAEASTSAKIIFAPTKLTEVSSIAATSAEGLATEVTLEMSTSAMTTSPTIDEITSVSTTPFVTTAEAATLPETTFVSPAPVETTIAVEMATSLIMTTLPTTTAEQLISENTSLVSTRGILSDAFTTMTRTEGSVTSELTSISESPMETGTTSEAISMQPVMTGEMATTDKMILSSTSILATPSVEGMISETVPSHSATEDGLELSTTAPTSERPTATTSLTAEVPSSPEISATTAKSMFISTTPVQSPITAISTTLPANLMVSTTRVESTSPTETASTAFTSTEAKLSSTSSSKSTAVIVLEKSTPALTTTVAPTSAEIISHLSPTSVKTTVASSPSATSTERITFKVTPSVGNILDTITPDKTMPFFTTAALTEKTTSLFTPSVITTGIELETSTPSIKIAGATTSAETKHIFTLPAVETSNVAEVASLAPISSEEITSENTPLADPFTGTDDAVSFGWAISDIPLVPYLPEEATTETIGSLQSTYIVGTTTIPQTKQTAVTDAHVEIPSKLTTTSETIAPMSSEEITPFATTLEAPTLGKTIFVSTTPVETTIPVEMATSSFMTALPATTTERLMSGKTPSISTQGISLDTSTTMTRAEAFVTSEMTSIFTSSTEISATSEAISMQPMTTGKVATTAKTLPFSTSHVETSIRTTPSVGIVLDTTTPAKTTAEASTSAKILFAPPKLTEISSIAATSAEGLATEITLEMATSAMTTLPTIDEITSVSTTPFVTTAEAATLPETSFVSPAPVETTIAVEMATSLIMTTLPTTTAEQLISENTSLVSTRGILSDASTTMTRTEGSVTSELTSISESPMETGTTSEAISMQPVMTGEIATTDQTILSSTSILATPSVEGMTSETVPSHNATEDGLELSTTALTSERPTATTSLTAEVPSSPEISATTAKSMSISTTPVQSPITAISTALPANLMVSTTRVESTSPTETASTAFTSTEAKLSSTSSSKSTAVIVLEKSTPALTTTVAPTSAEIISHLSPTSVKTTVASSPSATSTERITFKVTPSVGNILDTITPDKTMPFFTTAALTEKTTSLFTPSVITTGIELETSTPSIKIAGATTSAETKHIFTLPAVETSNVAEVASLAPISSEEITSENTPLADPFTGTDDAVSFGWAISDIPLVPYLPEEATTETIGSLQSTYIVGTTTIPQTKQTAVTDAHVEIPSKLTTTSETIAPMSSEEITPFATTLEAPTLGKTIFVSTTPVETTIPVEMATSSFMTALPATTTERLMSGKTPSISTQGISLDTSTTMTRAEAFVTSEMTSIFTSSTEISATSEAISMQPMTTGKVATTAKTLPFLTSHVETSIRTTPSVGIVLDTTTPAKTTAEASTSAKILFAPPKLTEISSIAATSAEGLATEITLEMSTSAMTTLPTIDEITSVSTTPFVTTAEAATLPETTFVSPAPVETTIAVEMATSLIMTTLPTTTAEQLISENTSLVSTRGILSDASTTMTRTEGSVTSELTSISESPMETGTTSEAISMQPVMTGEIATTDQTILSSTSILATPSVEGMTSETVPSHNATEDGLELSTTALTSERPTATTSLTAEVPSSPEISATTAKSMSISTTPVQSPITAISTALPANLMVSTTRVESTSPTETASTAFTSTEAKLSSTSSSKSTAVIVLEKSTPALTTTVAPTSAEIISHLSPTSVKTTVASSPSATSTERITFKVTPSVGNILDTITPDKTMPFFTTAALTEKTTSLFTPSVITTGIELETSTPSIKIAGATTSAETKHIFTLPAVETSNVAEVASLAPISSEEITSENTPLADPFTGTDDAVSFGWAISDIPLVPYLPEEATTETIGSLQSTYIVGTTTIPQTKQTAVTDAHVEIPSKLTTTSETIAPMSSEEITPFATTLEAPTLGKTIFVSTTPVETTIPVEMATSSFMTALPATTTERLMSGKTPSISTQGISLDTSTTMTRAEAFVTSEMTSIFTSSTEISATSEAISMQPMTTGKVATTAKTLPFSTSHVETSIRTTPSVGIVLDTTTPAKTTAEASTSAKILFAPPKLTEISSIAATSAEGLATEITLEMSTSAMTTLPTIDEITSVSTTPFVTTAEAATLPETSFVSPAPVETTIAVEMATSLIMTTLPTTTAEQLISENTSLVSTRGILSDASTTMTRTEGSVTSELTSISESPMETGTTSEAISMQPVMTGEIATTDQTILSSTSILATPSVEGMTSETVPSHNATEDGLELSTTALTSERPTATTSLTAEVPSSPEISATTAKSMSISTTPVQSPITAISTALPANLMVSTTRVESTSPTETASTAFTSTEAKLSSTSSSKSTAVIVLEKSTPALTTTVAPTSAEIISHLSPTSVKTTVASSPSATSTERITFKVTPSVGNILDTITPDKTMPFFTTAALTEKTTSLFTPSVITTGIELETSTPSIKIAGATTSAETKHIFTLPAVETSNVAEVASLAPISSEEITSENTPLADPFTGTDDAVSFGWAISDIPLVPYLPEEATTETIGSLQSTYIVGTTTIPQTKQTAVTDAHVEIPSKLTTTSETIAPMSSEEITPFATTLEAPTLGKTIFVSTTPVETTIPVEMATSSFMTALPATTTERLMSGKTPSISTQGISLDTSTTMTRAEAFVTSEMTSIFTSSTEISATSEAISMQPMTTGKVATTAKTLPFSTSHVETSIRTTPSVGIVLDTTTPAKTTAEASTSAKILFAPPKLTEISSIAATSAEGLATEITLEMSTSAMTTLPTIDEITSVSTTPFVTTAEAATLPETTFVSPAPVETTIAVEMATSLIMTTLPTTTAEQLISENTSLVSTRGILSDASTTMTRTEGSVTSELTSISESPMETGTTSEAISMQPVMTGEIATTDQTILSSTSILATPSVEGMTSETVPSHNATEDGLELSTTALTSERPTATTSLTAEVPSSPEISATTAKSMSISTTPVQSPITAISTALPANLMVSTTRVESTSPTETASTAFTSTEAKLSSTSSSKSTAVIVLEKSTPALTTTVAPTSAEIISHLSPTSVKTTVASSPSATSTERITFKVTPSVGNLLDTITPDKTMPFFTTAALTEKTTSLFTPSVITTGIELETSTPSIKIAGATTSAETKHIFTLPAVETSNVAEVASLAPISSEEITSENTPLADPFTGTDDAVSFGWAISDIPLVPYLPEEATTETIGSLQSTYIVGTTTIPQTKQTAVTDAHVEIPSKLTTTSETIAPMSSEEITPFATTLEAPTLGKTIFVSTTPVETTIPVEMATSSFMTALPATTTERLMSGKTPSISTQGISLDTSTTMTRAEAFVTSEMTSIFTSSTEISATSEAISMQPMTTGKVATTAKTLPFSTSHVETSIRTTPSVGIVLDTTTPAKTTAEASTSAKILFAPPKLTEISSIAATSAEGLATEITLEMSTSAMTTLPTIDEITSVSTTPFVTTAEAATLPETSFVSPAPVETTIAVEMATSLIMTTLPTTTAEQLISENTSLVSTRGILSDASTTMTRTEGSVTSELTSISESPMETGTTSEAISMQPVMTGEIATTDQTILSSTSILATPSVEGMTSETVPSHNATEDGLELSTTALTSERPTATTSLTAEVPSSPEISATTAKSMSISTTPVQSPITAISTALPANLMVSTTRVESTSPTETASTAFTSTEAKLSSTSSSKSTAVIVLEKSTPALTTTVAPTSAEIISHLSPTSVKTTVASSPSATSTERITFKVTPSVGNILDTITPDKTMPFFTTAALTEKTTSLFTPSVITTGIELETSTPSIKIAGATTSAETKHIFTLPAVETSNVAEVASLAPISSEEITSENTPLADPFTGTDDAVSFGWAISDIPLVPYLPEEATTETIGSLQSTYIVGTTTIPQTKQTAVTDAHVEIPSKLTTTSETIAPMSSEEITPFATTLEAPTLGKTIFVSTTPVETTIPVEMATSSFMTALPATTTERLMSGKTPSISTQGISLDTSTTMTRAEAFVTSEMTSIFTSSTEISATSEAISMQPMTTGKVATTAKTLPFSTSHVETSIRTTPSVGIVLDTTTPAKTTAEASTSAKILFAPPKLTEISSIAATSAEGLATEITLEMSTSAMTTLPTIDEITSVSTTPFVTTAEAATLPETSFVSPAPVETTIAVEMATSLIMTTLPTTTAEQLISENTSLVSTRGILSDASTTMTRTEGSVTSELTSISESPMETGTTSEAISMQPVMTGEIATTDQTILSSTSILATPSVEGMTSETVPSHNATEDGLELSTTALTSERPTATTSLTAEVPSSPEISATTAKSMSISTTPVQSPITAISTALPANLMVSTTRVESTSPTETASTAFTSTEAKLSSTSSSKSTAVIVLEKSTPALTTTVAPTSAEIISHLSPTSVKTTVASSPSATSTERITFKVTPSVGNLLDTITPDKTMPFFTTAALTEKTTSLFTPSVITTGIELETSTPSIKIAGATTSAETKHIFTLPAVETSNVAEVASLAPISSEEITSENTPLADPFTGTDDAVSFGWAISDIPLVPYLPEEATTETIGSLQSTYIVGTTTIPQTKQTAVTDAHVEIPSKLTTTSETIAPMSSEEITPFATTLEAPTLGKTIFVSTTPVETTIPVEMATSSFMTALPATTTERLMSGKTPSISTQGISLDTSTTMTRAEAFVTSEMTSIFTSSTEISATSEAISMQPMTTGKVATTAKTLPFSTSHVETSIRTTPSVGIVLDTTTPAKTTAEASTSAKILFAPPKLTEISSIAATSAEGLATEITLEMSTSAMTTLPTIDEITSVSTTPFVTTAEAATLPETSFVSPAPVETTIAVEMATSLIMTTLPTTTAEQLISENTSLVSTRGILSDASTTMTRTEGSVTSELTSISESPMETGTTSEAISMQPVMTGEIATTDQTILSSTSILATPSVEGMTSETVPSHNATEDGLELSTTALTSERPTATTSLTAEVPSSPEISATTAKSMSISTTPVQSPITAISTALPANLMVSTTRVESTSPTETASTAFTSTEAKLSSTSSSKSTAVIVLEKSTPALTAISMQPVTTGEVATTTKTILVSTSTLATTSVEGMTSGSVPSHSATEDGLELSTTAPTSVELETSTAGLTNVVPSSPEISASTAKSSTSPMETTSPAFTSTDAKTSRTTPSDITASATSIDITFETTSVGIALDITTPAKTMPFSTTPSETSIPVVAETTSFEEISSRTNIPVESSIGTKTSGVPLEPSSLAGTKIVETTVAVGTRVVAESPSQVATSTEKITTLSNGWGFSAIPSVPYLPVVTTTKTADSLQSTHVGAITIPVGFGWGFSDIPSVPHVPVVSPTETINNQQSTRNDQTAVTDVESSSKITTVPEISYLTPMSGEEDIPSETISPVDTYTGNASGFGWGLSDMPSVSYVPVVTPTEMITGQQSTQVVGTTTIPRSNQTAVTDAYVESASKITTVPEVSYLTPMSGEDIPSETISPVDTYTGNASGFGWGFSDMPSVSYVPVVTPTEMITGQQSTQVVGTTTILRSNQTAVTDAYVESASKITAVPEMTFLSPMSGEEDIPSGTISPVDTYTGNASDFGWGFFDIPSVPHVPVVTPTETINGQQSTRIVGTTTIPRNNQTAVTDAHVENASRITNVPVMTFLTPMSGEDMPSESISPVDTYTGNASGFGWGFSDMPSVSPVPVVTPTEMIKGQQSTQVVGTTTIPRSNQTSVTDAYVESASKITAVPEMTFLSPMSGEEDIPSGTISPVDTYTGNASDFGWGFFDIPSVPHVPVVTPTETINGQQSTRIVGTTTIPRNNQTAVTDAHVENASRIANVPEMTFLIPMSGEDIPSESISPVDTYTGNASGFGWGFSDMPSVSHVPVVTPTEMINGQQSTQVVGTTTIPRSNQTSVTDAHVKSASRITNVPEMTPMSGEDIPSESISPIDAYTGNAVGFGWEFSNIPPVSYQPEEPAKTDTPLP